MDQEGIPQLNMNVLMMVLAMVSSMRIKRIYKDHYNDKGGHVYIIVTSKCCVSGRSIYPEQNTYQRRDYNYVNRNKNYHGKL